MQKRDRHGLLIWPVTFGNIVRPESQTLAVQVDYLPICGDHPNLVAACLQVAVRGNQSNNVGKLGRPRQFVFRHDTFRLVRSQRTTRDAIALHVVVDSGDRTSQDRCDFRGIPAFDDIELLQLFLRNIQPEIILCGSRLNPIFGHPILDGAFSDAKTFSDVLLGESLRIQSLKDRSRNVNVVAAMFHRSSLQRVTNKCSIWDFTATTYFCQNPH